MGLTDWSMFGYNAQHTHFNPYEHILNPTNVSELTIDWQTKTPDSFDYNSSPAAVNGVVYVGSIDHKLYALNARTGAPLWSYTTGSSIVSSPAVANGVVYISSQDDKLYALDAQTGRVL